jgi:2-polyprenyl-3-methyl-5-hydroxy-6-metoxy-1,4-benzoquinol methylase
VTSWDERYGGVDLAYGSEPNRWLVAQATRIRPGGRVLSIGEGEGRNAVWLASQGFSVEAVDASRVGLEKARRIASARGLKIQTVVEDLERYRPELASYDAVVSIFVHLPPTIRAAVHAAAEAALRPGGVLVLEAFTPRQLGFESGGPKHAEMLYEPATLRADFPAIAWEILDERELVLEEGVLHQGRAAVVQGMGRRSVDQ